MRAAESYRRKTGYNNPMFKAQQARLIIALVDAGYTIRQVAAKVGVTHQRISQVYKHAKKISVHDYRTEVKVKQTEEALPFLLLQRRRVCPGCGIEFLMTQARKFHSSMCREEYYNLNQTKRESYKRRLIRQQAERDRARQ